MTDKESVELRPMVTIEINNEDVGVHVKTLNWQEDQDFATDRDQVWEWLCAASDNGHKIVWINIWNRDA